MSEGAPKLKTPEQVFKEERMREDAQNQFRLAANLYASVFGMQNFDDPEYGNLILEFWTQEREGDKSYSQKYRDFVNSDDFKNNPQYSGDISRIEVSDFI